MSEESNKFVIKGITEDEVNLAMLRQQEQANVSLAREIVILRTALKSCGCVKCNAAIEASLGRYGEWE